MFCKNCGAQIKDGSLFCPSCGMRVLEESRPTPVNAFEDPAPAPLADEPAPAPKKLNKGALIGIIAGGAAAILIALVLVLVLTLGGRSLESTVKQSFNAVKDLDASKIVNLAFPDEVLDYVLEQTEYEKKDFIEELQATLDELEEYDEFQEFRDSSKYTIKSTKNLKKKEIKALNETYENYYDIDDEEYIKDAADVTLKISSKPFKETITLRFVKIGSKWYFDTTQRIRGFSIASFMP